MNFKPVDNYYRQAHYDFFSKFASPFYALTFDLDITRLKAITDEKGYSIYLNLCYFFVKAMQPIEDFRYRVLDGRIVLYDTLHFGMTVPATKARFSFQYAEFDPDWERFNMQSNAGAHDEVSLLMKTHRNYVYFTALPGVRFTGLTHPTSSSKTDAEPGVCFGRFYEAEGRLRVPVGLQVNHIFIDGAHLNQLVEGVQRLYNDPS